MGTEPVGERYFYGFGSNEAEEKLRKIVGAPDPSPPAVHRLKDAVALPRVSGLYDIEGRRIEQAAVRMVSQDAPPVRKEKVYKGSTGQVSIPDKLHVVDEPVLFGGHLMNHYGHFIIESMSRLWARDLYPNLPILFTSAGKWRVAPTFGQEVLAALNLPERMRLVTEPTLFRDVVCPGTAIEYRWKAYSVADEPHVAVASALDRTNRRTWQRPVYLTRSGLSEGLRKSAAEPQLEMELSNRGFEVVRPETLSLDEQISMFEQAPLILGTVGSALHTALFSQSAGTLAILNWGRGFEHYLLVDGVKRHTSYYLKSMQRQGETGAYAMDVGLTLQLLQDAGLLERRTLLGLKA